MQLYKGYTKNSGKRPIDPLKGVKEFRTLEEVEGMLSYGGVLANNAILIDIDDFEQSEILKKIVEENNINCQIMRTGRGRHFTFENSGVSDCGTGKRLACGLVADIKVGSKNSVECLKIDGTLREIERQFDTNESTPLPKWLHPVNSSADFKAMEEGDGRDSALYGYILTLTNAGFSKDETRECIDIINRYMLKDALSEEDIERITRDDAFPAETFYKGKSFLHNNFAIFLKNNNHIKRINGQLHVYRDGVYVPGTLEIEAQMVKHLPMIKSAQRTEVLKYLELLCPNDSPVAPPEYIAFENGVLDIVTMEMLEFSPDIVVTNKVPWRYEPDAYSELADVTLNNIACNDRDIRAILEEAIGYCFYRCNTLSKSFFLTGSGANGKSTYLDLISAITGENNTAFLGLEELDERFSIATLSNKLANIGDDISDEFWQGKATSNFRKLVSGNAVKGEFKGQDAFFFKPYAKFFFSANALPRLRSRGFDAIKRRLVIIPFNAKFSPDMPGFRPHIGRELMKEESMLYLIRLGVAGLKRVLERQDFTKSDKVEAEIEDYELDNNPILLWLMETDDIVNQPCRDVFRDYKKFCVENGFKEITQNMFGREIKKRLNLTTTCAKINGKVIKIYIKEDEENEQD